MTAAVRAPGARRTDSSTRRDAAPASRPQARPELRVLTGRRRRRRQVVALSVLGLVAMFGIMLAVVGVQMTLLSTQERIDDLDAQIAEQREWNSKARLRIDTLSSPEVIVEGARALGMTEPDQPVYLVPTAAIEREVIEATHEAIDGPTAAP